MDKLIPLISILPFLAFWLWMAWDLGKNGNLPNNEKTYWMVAFLFLNVFAAGLYYVTEYRKRK